MPRSVQGHNSEGKCRVCAYDLANDFAASIMLARGRTCVEVARVTGLSKSSLRWHWRSVTEPDKQALRRRALSVALKADMAQIADNSVRIPIAVIGELIEERQRDVREMRLAKDPVALERAERSLHMWTMAYVEAGKDVRRHYYPAGPGVQVNVANTTNTQNNLVVARETALIEKLLEAVGSDEDKYRKTLAALGEEDPEPEPVRLEEIPHYAPHTAATAFNARMAALADD
jgi:hypothetical protein